MSIPCRNGSEELIGINGEWIDTLEPGPVIPFSMASLGLFTNPVDLLTIDWANPTAEFSGEKIYVGENYLLRRYVDDKGQEVLQEVEAPITWKQAETLLKENPLLMPYLTHLLEDPLGPVFNPSQWYVPATEPDGIGSLNIEIDRTIVTTDLRMEIKLIDHTGSSLYVDLLSSNYTVVASDLYGNLITDTDLMLWKTNDVPLASYPSAAVIRLRRGTGEITVGEMILYIDQDGDHLDAGQEALLGTSDLSTDSDADGTGDKAEVDAGTNPTNSASFLAGISGTISYGGTVTGAVTVVVAWTNSISPPFRFHVSGVGLPEAYTITNLPTLSNYWVFAFLDMNGNGSNECWEPLGSYAGNPRLLTDDTSGADITIVDRADADLDGLPDCWESKYFGSTTAAVSTADEEPDGLNNFGEYRLNTNPHKQDTDGDGKYDGGGYIHIQFTDISVESVGSKIRLEVSYPDAFVSDLDFITCTDLIEGDWSLALTTNANASLHRTTWVDPSSATRQRGFYVVGNAAHDVDGDGLASAREKFIYKTDMNNPDTDGDTLNDGDEVLLYGTSPTSSDSDSDGMPDCWEVANGTSPGVYDADMDVDWDGLSNIEEYQNATLPTVADTDGDGLNDGDEIAYGADPLVQDSDGDGLLDGEEVIQHNTSPTQGDTDGDDISDYREIAMFRSDPNTAGDLPTQYAEPSKTVYYGHPSITDTNFVYSYTHLHDDVTMGKGWIVDDIFAPDLNEPPATVYFGQPDHIDCPDVFVHSLTSTMRNHVDTGRGWITHGGFIADFSQATAVVYYGKPDHTVHPDFFTYGLRSIDLWSNVEMGKGWVITHGFVPDTNEPPQQIWYTRPDKTDNPTHWVYCYDFRVGGWYDIGMGWCRAASPSTFIPDLTEPSRTVQYGLPGEVGSSETFIHSYSITLRDDVILGQGWVTPHGFLADLNSTPWPIYYGNIQGHPDKFVFARTTIGMENWEHIGSGWVNMGDYVLSTEALPDLDGDGKMDGYDPFSPVPPETPDDSHATEMVLTVGDVSSSHTELYALHVGPCALMMTNISAEEYQISKTFVVPRGKYYQNSYVESLPDADDDGDYFATVGGPGIFVDDPSSVLGAHEDTGFNSGYKYFDVYLPRVDIVAHQPGTISVPGSAVSRVHENKKDAIIAYVNSDNDDGGPSGSHDYDNQTIGGNDDDIVKLTLKEFLPNELKKGTLELTVEPQESAVRIFRSATDVLDDMTIDLSSPTGNELFWVTARDLDLYVEILEYHPEITIKLAYKNPSGVELHSDRVCITVKLKANLVPDYGRDGIIDNDDRQKVLAGEKYYFWINSDDDSGYDGGNDIPGAPGLLSRQDWRNDDIDGVRDFIDFFPVHVDVSAALDVLPASGYDYVLKHKKGCFNAFVGAGLTPSQADHHLFDKTFCEDNGSANVTRITSGGYKLPEDFLIDAETGKGVILLEGRANTRDPLVLEIRRKSDNASMFETELPVSVDSVERMYRHINLRPRGGEPTSTNEPSNYPDSLCNDTNVFFLHGFNVTGNGARGWNSEIFKRLHWSGSNAKFWGVTWEGDLGLIEALHYQQCVANALAVSSNLYAQIDGITGTKIILAHSLGNMVVSGAIQDYGLAVDKYFMLNAAVATECYDPTVFNDNTPGNYMLHEDWIGYSNKTWCSKWFELFSSPDDRAKLTWKGRFLAVVPVAYNFYSSGDELFEVYTNGTPSPFTGGLIPFHLEQHAWQKQEMFKGRGGLGGTWWAGWGFAGEWEDEEWMPEYTMAQANVATYDNLQTNAVFWHEPASMFSSNITTQTVNDILAQGVPALSCAAGVTNALPEAGKNYDDNTHKPNEWPRSGGKYKERWLHNDLKDMAYLYTHELFNNLVIEGQLK